MITGDPRAIPLPPGARIKHADLGEGVVLDCERDGWLRAFFAGGERRVPRPSVQPLVSRAEQIIRGMEATPERLRQVWLSHEAHALPLQDGAAALTSAKIDLLPHQVVLTHRVATASPRRFLVADEVGLGKTIETALVLRELASRGELNRALMIVPAGLVNNWHRELNEVFNLNFEVFGSEGDITDRKTNAFARHDRLIASIDTLKRPARIKRLLAAPPWDLVVFDEAHHLTAWLAGGKVRKTENYKLAEALRGHTRDMLLLSATPHQGDHFRFWILIQLLSPGLFTGPKEMVAERHRLNAVMFRRTKADACRPDGTPLFARRWVHTESFLMCSTERHFYEQLCVYLHDGFDLARRQGNAGQALGFLMAIFQKIAASSFEAVRRTLHRRLLQLTLHEALLRDLDLDVEQRDRLVGEAREIIFTIHKLPRDRSGGHECDRILADLKLRLARSLDEAALDLVGGDIGDESAAQRAEEDAVVTLHLPEERLRIGELLAAFPVDRETKMQKLLDGLATLWKQSSAEKVVVFATYLGTVDLIGREIEHTFPGQGVVVLRGGDHGAKLAAERRFRQPDGPKVLVCTVAGREGINLQFARVLFNFDLPWNPMDVEQRIGRIHRYGQQHTAQVYNLVLSDTIEGRIFLLLEEKLLAIAKAVGKTDERGEVAEDLRAQILGQLAERLSYDKLYQEALSDPELKRTRVELEAALANSREAREVVFDLFQDLEGFSLDDYTPIADISSQMDRLRRFLTEAVTDRGMQLVEQLDESLALVDKNGRPLAALTLDRSRALGGKALELLGLDHPVLQQELQRWSSVPPGGLGVAIQTDLPERALLASWRVDLRSNDGHRRQALMALCIGESGRRWPAQERRMADLCSQPITSSFTSSEELLRWYTDLVEPALNRECLQRFSSQPSGFSADLLAVVELIPQP